MTILLTTFSHSVIDFHVAVFIPDIPGPMFVKIAFLYNAKYHVMNHNT